MKPKRKQGGLARGRTQGGLVRVVTYLTPDVFEKLEVRRTSRWRGEVGPSRASFLATLIARALGGGS